MLRLEITRLATRDLNEIILHIGKDDPGAAVAVVAKILYRIEMLREQPEIGRPGQCPGTRELVIDGVRYIAAYRIDTARKQIEILRVLHTARQWPRRL